MKRERILVKNWQHVQIRSHKTKVETGTAPEVVARFATRCTLDKELRSQEYWRAFIESADRLDAGSQQTVNHRQQAQKLACAGDYKSAIKVLFHALAINPWDAARYCEIGAMYHVIGESAQAVKAYRRALELQPNDAECLYKLGTAYWLCDDPCAAAVTFARAIKLKPDYSEAYDKLALIYKTYGYHDSAIEVLRRRLEICDNNADSAYGALACSLTYRERYEEAAAAYRRAAEIAPDNAKWCYGEGEALTQAGRYEEALIGYLQALEIAPRDMNLLISIACAYDHLGQFEQSEKVIERLGVILGDDHNCLERVANETESKADLYEFMNTLLDDLKENPNEWNNLTLPAFLDALRGSLAEGYDDYYGVRRLPEFNWKVLGQVLLAARSYE
jgi:tetratricopeptide (TPR) repeat protein